MSRFRTIQYMIDPESNQVYSRVESEVAIPVLDWDGMNAKNGYETNYNLEKFNVFEVCGTISQVIHTRKIPVELKNMHRKFWGMKALKIS